MSNVKLSGHTVILVIWGYDLLLRCNGGNQGLTPRAAELKWNQDFQRLAREQRPSNDLQGNATGLVTQLTQHFSRIEPRWATLVIFQCAKCAVCTVQRAKKQNVAGHWVTQRFSCSGLSIVCQPGLFTWVFSTSTLISFQILCATQVWVLWVPCREEQASLSYTDNSVEVSASKEQKAPTERQMQNMMESAQATWENEDSLLFTKAICAPYELPGSGGGESAGSGSGLGGGGNLLSPGAVQPNRKARKGGSGGGAGKGAGGQSGTGPTGTLPNMVVESMKFKKNTVKDTGRCLNFAHSHSHRDIVIESLELESKSNPNPHALCDIVISSGIKPHQASVLLPQTVGWGRGGAR